MFKKSAIFVALSTLFIGLSAQATTIYEKDNGDHLKLYGEVGVGGHFRPDYEFSEFFEDKSYIDDSFATLGVKGVMEDVYYRLEVDYERENWKYGSGDMVLAIDKIFIGYHITKNHAIEFGLTDTALDDYDKFGDFTLDTTVETGEAGDQANTVKYEGQWSYFKAGISYSYNSESSSGASLGDVINGYFGYFSDIVDVVVGAETRTGSEGESKYGEQTLFALGVRGYITDELAIGFNAYLENEDIAQSETLTDISQDFDTYTYAFNDYQTLQNKGALISASYTFRPKWELTGSANLEEYEAWDINSDYGVSPDDEYSWGKERTWATLGLNFKPSQSVLMAVEANFGEAAQDAYAYARVYF